MNRPRGVTILGWLAIIFGIFGLLGAILLVLGGLAIGALGAAGSLGAADIPDAAALAAGGLLVALVLGVFTALLSLVQIVFGIGTLQLKPWAWTLGIVWVWISLITNIFTLLSGEGFFNGLIGIFVAIGIMYYLYTDEVRAAFGKLDKAPPGFMVGLFRQMDKWFGKTSGGVTPPPGVTNATTPPGAYTPPPNAGPYAPPAGGVYTPPPPPPPSVEEPPAPTVNPPAPGPEDEPLPPTPPAGS